MPFARHQASAALTDEELVAAPGANRQIVVELVFLSSDTQQTVTLESTTTALRWEQYVSALGGQTIESIKALFRCAANESLTVTTSAAAKFFISVRYQIMRDTGE